MANFKRKRSKTKVRCTICTPYRNGNSFLRRIEQVARTDFKQQLQDN